jgi:hypothetical protein
VTACPNDVLIFGEVDEMQEILERAEEMKPEDGCEPLIRYIGLPKPFIAGEVYSPKEDLCLEGVKVTLTDARSGEASVVYTDNYGDFWLKGLEAGTYKLKINKDGYYSKKMSNIKVTKNGLNTGEIKLFKKMHKNFN